MDRPIVVVGAGVVGLACAAELARRGRWVIVLERQDTYGTGTSSRNSEVIHAGIYYEPGSLKARLCVEGRDRLYDYLGRRDLPHRRCGKLIVATEAAEIPQLEAIAARARQNGVEDLEWLDATGIRALEPGVRAVAALRSPSTGILDVHAFMDALARDVGEAGGDFLFRATLLGAEPAYDGWRLRIRDASGAEEEIEAAGVVNSAGLYADDVARLVLPAEQADALRQDWVKGNYFSIRPGAAVHASQLLYPCPHPELRGLGVHLTLDLAGDQRLGPDVEMLDARVEDYSVDDRRRHEFFAAAKRYLPGLELDDLAPGYAGLRPQRIVTGGFRDFYISNEEARGLEGWINLIGIESPGLTCALAIGRYVAELVTVASGSIA